MLSRKQNIGTVQLHGGVLVLHYFLIKSNDNKKTESNDIGEIKECVKDFDTIEVAVYFSPRDTNNYDVFEREFRS